MRVGMVFSISTPEPFGRYCDRESELEWILHDYVGEKDMYKRRLFACMLGGVISAVFCLIGRQIIYGFPDILWENIAATVANRLLLGFVIGISGWRINYLLHGAILGLVLSISVSIGFLPGDILGFTLFTSAGIIYGFMIEWITTNVFKAPMKAQ